MPGSFKFILATLDPPRLFNTLCDPPRFSKQSWTPPDHFGPSQTVLVPLRPSWSLSDQLGLYQTFMDPPSISWTMPDLLDCSEPSQTVLDPPKLSWPSQTVLDTLRLSKIQLLLDPSILGPTRLSQCLSDPPGPTKTLTEDL